MENITLHKENDYSTTAISNRFIDEYMTSANGEFVKIYLYLLRCMNSPDCCFSISKAADTFNHTEKDIRRALRYWEKMNLLQLEYAPDKSISGIYFLDSEPVPDKDDSVPLKKAFSPHTAAESRKCAPFPADLAKKDTESAHNSIASGQKTGYSADGSLAPAQKTGYSPDDSLAAKQKTGYSPDDAPATAQKPNYSADELKAFQEKEEIQELIFVAESYLKRPLTSTDIQTLLSWYDQLGLSTDLIVYLLEYCIAGGRSSLHYMDKVAANWKKENIKTVEQAKENAQAHSRLHYTVRKALGIQGRNLVPAESSYIERWHKVYGFGAEMIAEACSRTILAIHQPNFEYTERILASWKRQGIQCTEDIKHADAAFQAAKVTERAHMPARVAAKPAAPNRFNTFPQRAYNMDELEVELLNTAR